MGGHWLSSWQIAICSKLDILSRRLHLQVEVTLPYTAVVRQEVGPGDTVVALVSSDEAMTLQASLVVLQKDSYGRTLAVLLADSYMW